MRRRLRRRPAPLTALVRKTTYGKPPGHQLGGLRVVPFGIRTENGIRPRSYRAGGYAIPFLRSCRGTRRTRTLRFSLLRCGERPGGHPDVASGGYSYSGCPRYATWCVRGGAVSSVVTSGCPKRSEGGFPVGTRTYAVPRLNLTPYLNGIKGLVSPRARPSRSRR